MARVCVIRQGFYPIDVRLRREVQALALAGHQIEVICLKLPDQPRLEELGRIRLHRIPIETRRASRLRYLVEYSTFFVVAAARAAILHLRQRFDLVQVHSMPDALVFAAIVPRLLGARVLLDLHECMPEFYAVKFGTNMRHPLVRLVAWMEQAAIRFADAAITCTELMREAFEGRGAPAGKLTVIMNSANEDEFDPRRYPPARVAGEFRVIIHGSIERRYGVDTIVQAVALLKDEIPGLRLDILGYGTAVPEIQSLVTALGIEDRVFLPARWMPLPDVIQAIANADVGVVAMQRDIFRDLTHCNKMFEYIAMRKPAIVSRTRSIERYFDDTCFRLFTAGDVDDLAQAIRDLYADPALGKRLATQAASVTESFRWPRQRERYDLVVRTLLAKGKAAAAPLPKQRDPEAHWQ